MSDIDTLFIMNQWKKEGQFDAPHSQPPTDAPSPGAQEALPLSEADTQAMLDWVYFRGGPTAKRPDIELALKTALAAHRLKAALTEAERKLREAEKQIAEWRDVASLAQQQKLERERNEAIARADIADRRSRAYEAANEKLIVERDKAIAAQKQAMAEWDEAKRGRAKFNELIKQQGGEIGVVARRLKAMVEVLTAELARAREAMRDALDAIADANGDLTAMAINHARQRLLHALSNERGNEGNADDLMTVPEALEILRIVAIRRIEHRAINTLKQAIETLTVDRFNLEVELVKLRGTSDATATPDPDRLDEL